MLRNGGVILDKAITKMRMQRTIRIVLILVVILLISFPIFAYFKISTGANLALRKAQNVKLAFMTIDIEYYGHNMSVYDSTRNGKMAENVEMAVRKLLDEDGVFEITSYDRKERMVTGMKYTDSKYQVIYRYDENGDHWKVDYLFNVISEKE